MPGDLLTHALGRATSRVPGLRRIPVMRLLAIGEVALLARTHINKLTPAERHRFVELMRLAHGRPSHLSRAERDELSQLVAKAEPRLFAGAAIQKLSPLPVPGRFVRGSRKR
jgi:hypothetical protein